LFYRGEVAFSDKDYERAKKFFNQALENDDNLQGPRYRLAQLALMAEQKTKARSYLISELKLASEDADTLVSMGSMFLTVDDLGCATHCFLRAIDLDSSNAQSYYYLGLSSVMRGELEEAAELFTHTLDIESEHLPTLRDSAYVYLTLGKLNDAAERIKKARSLAPQDFQIKALERRIKLAKIFERIRRLLPR
jgi:tetratricopeptide (TPR) repeat protein